MTIHALRTDPRVLSGFIAHRGLRTIYGVALPTDDVAAYLRLRAAIVKHTDDGLAVTTPTTITANVAPVFMNGVGWAYLVDDLDAAVGGE